VHINLSLITSQGTSSSLCYPIELHKIRLLGQMKREM